MQVYKKYKNKLYRFGKKEKLYSYTELQDHFCIDGSEVVYCKKSFEKCKSGKYYLIFVGGNIGEYYIVNDSRSYEDWKKYTKSEARN